RRVAGPSVGRLRAAGQRGALAARARVGGPRWHGVGGGGQGAGTWGRGGAGPSGRLPCDDRCVCGPAQSEADGPTGRTGRRASRWGPTSVPERDEDAVSSRGP